MKLLQLPVAPVDPVKPVEPVTALPGDPWGPLDPVGPVAPVPPGDAAIAISQHCPHTQLSVFITDQHHSLSATF